MNAGVAQRSHKAPRTLTTSDWQVMAVCRNISPSTFYPEDEQDGSKGNGKRGRAAKQLLRDAEERAKLICRGCPVRTACLQYALDHQEHGIWGGLTEDERAEVKRRRAARRTA